MYWVNLLRKQYYNNLNWQNLHLPLTSSKREFAAASSEYPYFYDKTIIKKSNATLAFHN